MPSSATSRISRPGSPGRSATRASRRAWRRRAETSARGRDFVERRHDWAVIASGVVAALRAGRHLPPADGDPVDALIERVSSSVDEIGAAADGVLLRQVSTALTEAGFARPDQWDRTA